MLFEPEGLTLSVSMADSISGRLWSTCQQGTLKATGYE